MADTLKQVQIDRSRMIENNKGATESSRAALSAISGRLVLKTKTETEKLRRNEEIAAQQNAALVAMNKASGNVALEKARLSAAQHHEVIELERDRLELANRRLGLRERKVAISEKRVKMDRENVEMDRQRLEFDKEQAERDRAYLELQKSRQKKDEVLTMLNLGIYDPSFATVLGMPEDVVRQAAANKKAKIDALKAAKAKAAQAQADYEAALAARDGAVAKEKAWYETNVDSAITTAEETGEVSGTAAEVKENILASANVGKVLIPWATPTNALTTFSLSGATDVRMSGGKIPETTKKTVEQIKKQAEAEKKESEKRLKAASAYYDRVLTEKIYAKEKAEKELSALEASFKKEQENSTAYQLRMKRFGAVDKMKNATTVEEVNTAYNEYFTALDEKKAEILNTAEDLYYVNLMKTYEAEDYTAEERKRVEQTKAELQEIRDLLLYEIENADLTEEGAAILQTEIENIEAYIGAMDAAIYHDDHYTEIKGQLLYDKLEAQYSHETDAELKKEIADLEALKADIPADPSVILNWADLERNKEIEAQIKEIQTYIEQRTEKEKNAEQDERAAETFEGMREETLTAKMLSLMGNLNESEKQSKEGYVAPPDKFWLWSKEKQCEWFNKTYGTNHTPENFSAASELGKIKAVEMTVSKDGSDVLYDASGYFHRNIVSSNEALFNPESLEQYAAQAVENANMNGEKLFVFPDDENVNEMVLADAEAMKKYAKGIDGLFEGNYSSVVFDFDGFLKGEYGNFTEQEAKTILALMAKYGTDEAFVHYAAVRDEALKRKAEEFTGFGRVVRGVASGLTQFLTNGGEMLENAFTQQYSRIAGTLGTASHQINMENFSQKTGIANDALEMLYMSGYSILDMVPAVALGAVPHVGTYLSSAYTFAKVTATTYNDSILAGKRADEALTYAMLSATAEVGLEKILNTGGQTFAKGGFGKAWKESVENLASTKAMQVIIKTAGSMGSEGFEEFLQECISPFLEKVAADLNGIDDATLKEIDWEEAAKSFAIGAITGGIFGGFEAVSSTKNAGMKESEARALLESGKAVGVINAAAELGNKRALAIKQAKQNGQVRYAGQEGWFAYASPADIVNITQSVKRKSVKQSMAILQEKYNAHETNKEKQKTFDRLFKKILWGNTLTLQETADIINDQEMSGILNEMLGMDVTMMTPDRVLAVAKLAAFAENGKISQARINLFKDAFGELDADALTEIVNYSDMAAKKVSGILYEDANAESQLTEAEQESAEVLKILSSEVGTVFYVTDQFDTGTYLAANMMAVRPGDLAGGVFKSATHRAYYMAKQLMADKGVNFKAFLLSEAKRIKGEQAVEEQIKTILQQSAENGNDISRPTAEDELCARLLGELLQQEGVLDQLAAADLDMVAALRKVLASVEGHLNGIKQSQKNSSIKEDLKNSEFFLNSMEPVAEVNDEKIFRSKQDLVNWVVSLFEKIDYKVVRGEFGEIIIDRKRISNGTRYLKTNDERLAFAALPEVLEKGTEVAKHTAHKNRIYDTVTIAAPILLNGQRVNMAVVVRIEGMNYYKVHRIAIAEEANKKRDIAERAGGVETNSGLSPADNVSKNSISKSSKNVNPVLEVSFFDGGSAEVTDLVDRMTRLVQGEETKVIENKGAMDGSSADGADFEDGPKSLKEMWERNAHINDNADGIGTDRSFKGTEAMQKAGIEVISGAVADYNGRESTDIDQAKSLRALNKKIRKYEQDNGVTQKERTLAKSVLTGIFTLEELPETINRGTIEKLVELYEQRTELQGHSGRSMRSVTIRTKLDALAKEEADRLGPAQNWVQKVARIKLLGQFQTPKRMLEIFFGFKAGEEVWARWFAPADQNNMHRECFLQHWRDKLRVFEGKDGEQRSLRKAERPLVQMLIEGMAYDDLIAEPVIGDRLRIATKEIFEGKITFDEAVQNFKLGTKKSRDMLMDCVASYTLRAQVQMAIANDPTVDGILIKNAAEAFHEAFELLYDAANDFLIAHGMEPIGKINAYTPHMQIKSFFEKFKEGIQMAADLSEVSDIPVAIAGLTADFKPNRKFDPHFLQRKGTKTDYDIYFAFDRYLDYFSKVIYHTDDVMRIKALERMIRSKFSGESAKNEYERVKKAAKGTLAEKKKYLVDCEIVESADDLTLAEVDRYIEARINSVDEQLGSGNDGYAATLVEWLQDMYKVRAGKQSDLDRGIEALIGRRVLSMSSFVLGLSKSGKVVLSASSFFKQSLQLLNVHKRFGTKITVRAFNEAAFNWKSLKGFRESLPLLVGKDKSDPLSVGGYTRFTNKLGWLVQWVDRFVSTVSARAGYLEAVKRGMGEYDALFHANDVATEIMGSREQLVKPRAFNAKNPIMQAITVFAVEACNSIHNLTFDTVADAYRISRTDGIAPAVRFMVRGAVTYMIMAFIANRFYDDEMNQTPVPLDIPGILLEGVAAGHETTARQFWMEFIDNISESMGGDRLYGTEPKERTFDTVKMLNKMGEEALDDFTIVSNVKAFLGVGNNTSILRDPFVNAKTIYEDLEAFGRLSEKSSGIEYAEVWTNLIADVVSIVPFLGNQARKTLRGSVTVADGGSYKVNNDGERQLMYPVENTLEAVQSILLGEWSTYSAEKYLDTGKAVFTVSQTKCYEELVDMGVSRQKAYEFIDELRGIEKTEKKSEEKLQREFLLTSSLNESEMGVVYYHLMADEEERAWVDSLISNGANKEELLNVLLDIKDVKTGDGERRKKQEILFDATLTDAEKVVVYKERITTEHGEEIADLTDAGLTFDQYLSYKINTAAVDGKSANDYRKFKAIDETGADENVKIKAARIVANDSNRIKLTIFNEYDIGLSDVVAVMDKVNYLDDQFDGGVTNTMVKTAINDVDDMSDTQRAVLWQLFTGATSAKNNPYSSSIGAKVVAKNKALKEVEEE